MSSAGRVRPAAAIRGRCPRCGEGAIFEPLLGRGALRMHPRCPVCGLDFEPEEGYFTGAMYVSYSLGILTVLPVAMLLILALGASLALTLTVALVQTLLTTLIMFRYSRIIWLHIDQVIQPR
jgi:uncharacterized protein (DUF983 family)